MSPPGGSGAPTGMSTSFAEAVLRWRWLIILLVVGVTVAAGSGMTRLQPQNDARIWFGPDNPQRLALESLERTYNKIDNVYIAVAPESGDVFTRRTLTALVELTEAAWQLPDANRVDSITNFQHTEASGDELVVGDLVENPATLDDTALERIRRIALAEPQLVNRLLAPDGRATGINVNIIRSGTDPDESTRITAAAEALVADFQARYPELHFYITGGVPFDAGFGRATKDDLRTFVPAMFAVIALTMALLLRSVWGMLVTMLVIACSTVTAMGFAGWVGMGLNPASGIAPTIILTLAVADSIHILVTAFQQMAQGLSRRAALVRSLELNMQPVAITSLTTAIGFLSMNFSDAPPFHDLGNIVAVGVTAAWLYSITLLPALASLLPLRAQRARARIRPAMEALAEFVIRRPRLLLYGIGAAALLLLTGIPRIELNDNFMEYLDPRYPVRQASSFVQEHLTGMDAIEYSLPAAGSGGIADPDYLQTLDDFANWLRTQPDVAHVNSITDILRRLNRNLHGDDPAWYRLPESRELAAQYLLLYEMSLPYGLDLNNRISVDKSATRVTVLLRHQTARSLRELDARARAWLAANAPPYMQAQGSGLSLMFAHVSETNINAMLGGSLLALVLISLLLILALKSLRYGLLSMVPNLGPALMAFGIWGYAVGQVGLASAVLVALTLGIVVDDTVHFLSKYLRALREHATPQAAVRHAFGTVGTAMWVTTLILVAGFGTLALSGYKVNADMGLLTALTIVLALALDFLLLPALLLRMGRRA